MAAINDDVTPLPTQPQYDIDSDTLLSHTYSSLTVKELREMLRQYGARVSGNKRELVDRLGDIMHSSNKEEEPKSEMQNDGSQLISKIGNGKYRLDEYNQMTLKELKDILRQHGATTVSGNKRELIQKCMNLQSLLPRHTIDYDGGDKEWSILQPNISYEKASTIAKEYDIELPTLSGLIFVNKPSGYSTLPTKQQLDNPSQPPTYKCLSDSVKKWLYSHPEGKQRIKQALAEEEQWWEFKLQSLANDPKRRKKLEKRREKLKSKLKTTFEPRPVHRLDIDTSGIVCIALTPYALRAANMLFEKKSKEVDINRLNSNGIESDIVQKQYVALVENSIPNEANNGAIKHSIGKVWIEDHNEWACDIFDDGTAAFIRPADLMSTFVPNTLRDAITSYRAISSDDDNDVSNTTTRVELTPHTGRGHQLRLHMASLGYPIVGDDMHGEMNKVASKSSPQLNDGKLCLHASNLSMDAWYLNGDKFEICRVSVESSPPF